MNYTEHGHVAVGAPNSLARIATQHGRASFPPTPGTLKAIRLFAALTGNSRFDLWTLAGHHHAANRAILLSAIRGERLPQSKAGITALRAAFYRELGIVGECEAEREENFRFVCSELLPAAKAARPTEPDYAPPKPRGPRPDLDAPAPKVGTITITPCDDCQQIGSHAWDCPQNPMRDELAAELAPEPDAPGARAILEVIAAWYDQSESGPYAGSLLFEDDRTLKQHIAAELSRATPAAAPLAAWQMRPPEGPEEPYDDAKSDGAY